MGPIDNSPSNQVQKHSNEQILLQSLSESEAFDISPNPTSNEIINTDKSQRKSQEIAPAIYMGSPPINQLITKGSFVVLANSQQGTYFQNVSSVSRKVKFKALGTWIIDSKHCSAKGLVDNQLSNSCLLSTAPIGCLLFKRFNPHNNFEKFTDNTDSTSINFKLEKDIELKPMETLCFVSNSNPDSKNEGYLVVDWEFF
jgi:hypothetical protein